MASDVVNMWKSIIVKETLKNKKNETVENGDSVKAEPAATEINKVKNIQRSNSVKVEQNSTAKKLKAEGIKSEVSSSIKIEKAEPDATETNKVKNTQRSNSVKVEQNSAAKKLKVEGIKSEVKIEKSEVVQTTKNATGKHVKVETKVKVEKPTSEVRKTASDPVGPPKLTSLVYCKDPIRDKLREIIAEALCKVSKELNDDDLKERVNDCDPYRVAVIVETTMFEKWGKSNGAQKFKYRSVIFNIKDPKNPDFRRKVLLGDIEPRAILELTPEEMASEERQAENKELKEKGLFNSMAKELGKASTDQFTCGRCKKKECTYQQMQTRSADEPMTTYVTCTNCLKVWKFC